MSMNVPSGADEGEAKAMSDINVTPMVDVMLVLLIIFLITIPVITKTVPVELPKATNIATQTKPENITIAIDRNGDIYWNNGKVRDRQALLEFVKAAAVQEPQPEIHIRGDRNARYEAVGRVLYTIQRGGVVKVGFITEPDRGVR